VNNRAGVRATNGVYKTVYLAIGIEQLTNTTVKNTILKLSHDWFYGLTSTEEFDHAMAAISMGQNYPNPAQQSTIIPLFNVEQDIILRVTDMTGRIVHEQQVTKNTGYVNLNTSSMESGLYTYSILDGKQVIITKPMGRIFLFLCTPHSCSLLYDKEIPGW
jgi:hypothetical protein